MHVYNALILKHYKMLSDVTSKRTLLSRIISKALRKLYEETLVAEN